MLASIATSLALGSPADAAPAFPDAAGFGAAATGGRGGQVITVTTLAADGPGSLQAAVDVEGPRIIVFAVSGIIDSEIEIPYGDVTIAGQSAPGAGITIGGRLVTRYEYGIDNIVIRHIRVRPTMVDLPGEQVDAIQFSRSDLIMLDHVSASFGIDETVDLYEAHDVTVQWSTISSSAEQGHPENNHNYGLINGPDGARASLHHNLFAHHRNRCPALATGPSEVRNNVAYNVRHGFIHHNPAQEHFSVTGNYYKAGSDSNLIPFFLDDENGGADPQLGYFFAGNYIDDPGVLVGIVDNPWQEPFAHPSFESLGLPQSYRRDTDYDFSSHKGHVEIQAEPAEAAYENVLNCAGAFPRDVVTTRSVTDTREGTGTWGSNVPADLLEGLNPGQPEPDGDNDGMPDAWETDNGLDPDDPADALVIGDNGYMAVEDYLNARADLLIGPDCADVPGPDPDPGTGSGSDSDGGSESGTGTTDTGGGPGPSGATAASGFGSNSGGPTSPTSTDTAGASSSGKFPECGCTAGTTGMGAGLWLIWFAGLRLTRRRTRGS